MYIYIYIYIYIYVITYIHVMYTCMYIYIYIQTTHGSDRGSNNNDCQKFRQAFARVIYTSYNEGTVDSDKSVTF